MANGSLAGVGAIWEPEDTVTMAIWGTIWRKRSTEAAHDKKKKNSNTLKVRFLEEQVGVVLCHSRQTSGRRCVVEDTLLCDRQTE